MDKYKSLISYLKELKTAAVAFSGGVDSSLLLKAARDALGDNAIAVTVRSPLFTERELAQSKKFCDNLGVKHIIAEFDPFSIDGFRENPPNRCYICKKELFSLIANIAGENGIVSVAEGSNLDDMSDYRPGMLAIEELKIKSPLRRVGLTKAEIRELSRQHGLPNWDKQSLACLASRFEYGDAINREKLAMVKDAEQILFNLGFRQFRVRIKDKTARVEILPDDFSTLISLRETVIAEFNKIGFTYVSMDLRGYRTGSMNETLKKELI